MKKVFLLLMVAIATTAVAQKVTYNEVENATDPKKQLLKEYQEYVASDGHTYKVGDKLTFGVPSSGKTYAYITSELSMANYALNGGAMQGVNAQMGGRDMVIKKISIQRSKQMGAMVSIRGYISGMGGFLIQIENALNSGEIVSLGMTSDKALAELKNAKDKLELEVITQQEFDSIKALLKPYIK
ncbi:MAG: hypothetical protein MJ007_01725 [Paludibacteraceae bacterium]|nr:hypothetical protein [Paludibacteraceae bacterium]